MNRQELNVILDAHALWIRSNSMAGTRADLTGKTFIDLNLAGRDLRWAILWRTQWVKADFRGALLSGANFFGAVLRGADLRDADLVRANFRTADLRDADLRGAKLVHRDGPNELDLPREIHAADFEQTLIEGARVSRQALAGTGAFGPYQYVCNGEDRYAPPAPRDPRRRPGSPA